MSGTLLFLATFLACAVEAVEALTIVLAVGLTRGWRSPLIGVAAATVVLAGVVAALGPALTHIPLDVLRIVVGALLLVFGLQWLRKAVLRASGLKALRDEEAVFARERQAALEAGATSATLDWYAFTLSFKGVFLEGLEVAFIVLTFGTTSHDMTLSAIAAGAALAVVIVVGLIAHAPLARVPENTMKFAVGLMLTTFGIFWSAEGVGVHWPGSDAALLAILGFLAVCSLGIVRIYRVHPERAEGSHDAVAAGPGRSGAAASPAAAVAGLGVAGAAAGAEAEA